MRKSKFSETQIAETLKEGESVSTPSSTGIDGAGVLG